MSELTFQDPKKKFCEMLVEARTSKNLDISRVAEKSKIAQHYLEKIEAGEWDFLPHAYVRAFLRTYVQILGLNVEEILAQFDDIVDEPPVPIPGRTGEDERERERGREGKGKRRRPGEDEDDASRKPLTFTLAGEGSTAEPRRTGTDNGSGGNPIFWVGGLVIAAAIVGALLFWPRGKTTTNGEEIPFNDVVEEHEHMVADKPQQPAPEEVSKAQEEIAKQGEQLEQELQNELTLVTQAVQRCYIRVTADRDSIPLDDVVLDAGMSRTYFADSVFTIVVGNAGGMKLILDGNDLGPLGEEGRVVTAYIGPNGLRRLRLGARSQPKEEKTPVEKPAEPAIDESILAPGTSRTSVKPPSKPDTTRQQ
jgi:transcriptional regulator with XRE-family HTH domain